MRRTLRIHAVLPALALAAICPVALAQAPASGPATGQTLGKDDITTFAKLQIAIDVVHDSADAELAMAKNKKDEAHAAVQAKLETQIADILHHSGMTDAEYQHKIFLISTDTLLRRTFDSVIAKLTGVPTPGQVAAAAPTVKVPAGMVGTHIGHVVNSFADTPNKQGLLPVAMAEARTAAQHAQLAGRQPGDLAMMKLHAGHVINAIDPTLMPMGPGLGYGVKKASLGVATHIELAAKVDGASQNVILHSMHIATSARNTVDRCDQAIAIAQKVQAATTAPEAAALVSQLISITNQLIAGADANGDGRITWEKGEGGLQTAQDHVNLMLAAEGSSTSKR
jgi:hypothetical protein